MDVFYILLFFILGTCWGSFANVVIYRWPKELSVIKPRSRCPNCNNQLKFYHNIPIFSWLFLKGKCGFCQAPISISYPLIEALTGALFVSLYLTTGLSLITVNMCIFTALAIPCFFIDLKHMYLPDIMTLPGLGFALIISFFNSSPQFIESLLGALIGGGVLWLLAYSYKKIRGVDGMGGGDIKLLAWIGALYGVQSISYILFLSSMTGAIVGLYFLFFKKKDPKTFAIPFGPFIIGAAYAYYFTLWVFPL